MELLTVVLTLGLFLSNSEAIFRNSTSFKNEEFTDKKILEQPIGAYSVRSLVDCNRVCLETGSCSSCAYNSITMTCLLWDTDFVHALTTNVSQENGWRYYYAVKVSDCTMTENACHSNSGFIYEPDSCFCYKFLSTQRTYDDAGNACKAINASLAQIYRGLIQLRLEKFLDTVSANDVRIQGVLDFAALIWKYDDGSQIKYFNWNKANGQPNTIPSELSIFVRKSAGYRWHDAAVSTLRPAICQMTNV